MSQYVIIGIFAVTGILSFLAALLNWEWFFTSQNAQFIVRRLGLRKSRFAYGIFGLAMVAFAVYLILTLPKV